jgi:hypothetical protein
VEKHGFLLIGEPVASKKKWSVGLLLFCGFCHRFDGLFCEYCCLKIPPALVKVLLSSPHFNIFWHKGGSQVQFIPLLMDQFAMLRISGLRME